MIWDTEAYANGISEHAAGSSIETFVDCLDATIAELDPDSKPTDDLIGLAQLRDYWSALRETIVAHPLNGELTFAKEED